MGFCNIPEITLKNNRLALFSKMKLKAVHTLIRRDLNQSDTLGRVCFVSVILQFMHRRTLIHAGMPICIAI